MYAEVLIFYSCIFEQLEDEGKLDVYILGIENTLEELVRQMNNRPVSIERNQSPLQMREMGMLENLHSGHTALSEVEVEHFGPDQNGALAVDDQDYEINFSPPVISLSDEQIIQLPNPLLNYRNNGKNLYLACVEVINMFLTSS